MQRVLEIVARVSLTMRAGRHSPQDGRLPARQDTGREIRMKATFCVFNRTRESFLCLSAIGTLPTLSPNVSTEGRELWMERSKPAREDGMWLMRSPGKYTVGRQFPVDRIYLDQGNRVLQLIEHLNPLQIVSVHCCYASVLEVRIRTIYSSRTRVGDKLLICFPQDVQTKWEELQVQTTWMRQEAVPCSEG
jgi:uncharacterized membrane protein (UPF0127 family)